MKKITGVCVSVAVLTVAALLLIFFPSQKENQKENPPANKSSSVNPEWYKTDRDYQRERKTN